MTTIRAVRADTYDGGRWLRLAATTEREWRMSPTHKWVPWDPQKPTMTDLLWEKYLHSAPEMIRTRTVSPVLPADLTELVIVSSERTYLASGITSEQLEDCSVRLAFAEVTTLEELGT